MLTVSTFDLQEVAVNSYLCDEYTAVEHKLCCTAASDISAVMFLYDSIDKCMKDCENFQRAVKLAYSVIVITVIVKSAAASLSDFTDTIKQLADVLPDGVIANGVIVNVGGFFSYNNHEFVVYSLHL